MPPALPESLVQCAWSRDDRVERAMTAESRYPAGHTGRVCCSMWSTSLLQMSVKVVGEHGELRVLNPVLPQLFHRLTVRSANGKRVERFPRRASYSYQLDAFADAVFGSEPVKTSPQDTVENMTVIDAVYRAGGLPLRAPA